MMLNKTKEIGHSPNFSSLGLRDKIVDNLIDRGYEFPTQVQEEAIPFALDNKDVLATAQTGTGKTAAFILPILQNLLEKNAKQSHIRALILTPTRELAVQISEFISEYGQYLKLKHVTVYGGVNQKPQVHKLRKGVDIVVATPGRLIDLINQGHIKLGNLEHFVLDEADRMLDMGFLPDIELLMEKTPNSRQTLLFSATMPDEIVSLAKRIQNEPKIISIDDGTSSIDLIDSFAYFVDRGDKYNLLIHLFETQPDIQKVIIFCRTKYNCNKLVKKLRNAGFFADKIHGDRSQNQRENALDGFRDGKFDILVATDVASRGLDIDDVTHVINFEITNEPKVHIHRIGRTARAGKDGISFSFVSKEEFTIFRNIEIEMQEHMIRIVDHPYMENMKEPQPTDLTGKITDSVPKKRKRKRGFKSNKGQSRYRGKKRGSKKKKAGLVSQNRNNSSN